MRRHHHQDITTASGKKSGALEGSRGDLHQAAAEKTNLARPPVWGREQDIAGSRASTGVGDEQDVAGSCAVEEGAEAVVGSHAVEKGAKVVAGCRAIEEEERPSPDLAS
jgi:hypothetical protein